MDSVDVEHITVTSLSRNRDSHSVRSDQSSDAEWNATPWGIRSLSWRFSARPAASRSASAWPWPEMKGLRPVDLALSASVFAADDAPSLLAQNTSAGLLWKWLSTTS